MCGRRRNQPSPWAPYGRFTSPPYFAGGGGCCRRKAKRRQQALVAAGAAVSAIRESSASSPYAGQTNGVVGAAPAAEPPSYNAAMAGREVRDVPAYQDEKGARDVREDASVLKYEGSLGECEVGGRVCRQRLTRPGSIEREETWILEAPDWRALTYACCRDFS